MGFINRVSAWWRAHPRLGDGLIIAPVFVLAVIIDLLPSGRYEAYAFYMQLQPGWVHQVTKIASTVLYTVPWVFRRTNPVGSACWIVVGALIQLIAGPDTLFGTFMVFFTIQNLAHRAPRWASTTGLVLGLTGALLLSLRVSFLPVFISYGDQTSPEIEGPYGTELFFFVVVFTTACVLFAWAIGNLQRARRIRNETLRARTRQLEVEAHQERQLAVADERNRIARELHDIVAHSLQVVISQADGARYAAAKQPEVAVSTLETISKTGRETLSQMRKLLGVLRATDQPDDAPQPQLRDLPQLFQTVRMSGLEVEFAETGAAQNRRELPEGVELVIYRIVQEALTNVIRHAGPGAQARVVFTWRDDGVAVTIENDGDVPVMRDNSGQGLVGMQERAKLYDGTLSAGPRVGGGFRVHAQLPFEDQTPWNQ